MEERRRLTLGDERYELLQLIGEGGMARVWRARDHKLHVDVAIKIIVGEGKTAEIRSRRLLNEARALMRTRHPAIVRVHDIVEDDGPAYIVMDHVPGGSLQGLLDERKGSGGLPPRRVAGWMIEILGALGAAHAQKVIHRDVKPSNVLLDAGGRALLADFGIAILLDEDRHTRTHISMGSMMYMPPEQRLDAKTVGPSADLYAVGTTLYHLVTGCTPVDLFLADTSSPRWDEVPGPLRPVLVRATRQEPADRFATAEEMAAALRLAAEQLPEEDGFELPASRTTPLEEPTLHGTIDLHLPGKPPAPPRPPWARTGLFAAALALLATGGILVAYALFGEDGTEPVAALEVPAPAPEPPSAPSPAPAPAPEPVATAPVTHDAPSEVAPATRAKVESRPTTLSAPFGGRWTGSMGLVVAELDLSGGPEAVRGHVITSASEDTDAPREKLALTGRFEADAGSLVLTVAEGSADEARLDLVLDAGGNRLKGSIARRGGTLMQPAVFHRTR